METATQNNKRNKIIWAVISWIVFAIVILFAITAIMSKFSIGGIELLTVQSGSMEPTIKTGSVVLIKSESDYSVGDIVTYKSNSDPNEKITHRIVEIFSDNGVIKYRTKGDANDVPDAISVLQDQIIGREVLDIPYIGYPIGYARTPTGLVLIVIIPATIIIYDEVAKIRKETRAIVKNRQGKKKAEKNIETLDNSAPKKGKKESKNDELG